MRRFYLARKVDVSGVSGTGRIAEGCTFDNGFVALTWLTGHFTLSYYNGIDELIEILHRSDTVPTRLFKMMTRREAELAFRNAVRKEVFQRTSLYSYLFEGGWLEFQLHFDESNRLRRLYILHQALPEEHGLEVPLRAA